MQTSEAAQHPRVNGMSYPNSRPIVAVHHHLPLLPCGSSDRTFAARAKLIMVKVAIRRLGASRLELFYPSDERFREGEIFVYFLPTTNSDPSSSGAIFDVVNMIWCALGVDFDNSTNSRWKFQDRS